MGESSTTRTRYFVIVRPCSLLGHQRPDGLATEFLCADTSEIRTLEGNGTLLRHQVEELLVEVVDRFFLGILATYRLACISFR